MSPPASETIRRRAPQRVSRVHDNCWRLSSRATPLAVKLESKEKPATPDQNPIPPTAQPSALPLFARTQKSNQRCKQLSRAFDMPCPEALPAILKKDPTNS